MNICKPLFFLIIGFVLASCNRTYLTEEEKNWNPYKKGQKLLFKSQTGVLDSIVIEKLKYGFPDGPGFVERNEIAHIVGRNRRYKNNREVSSYIFSVYAKTKKRNSSIRFGISLKDYYFNESYYYDIEDYLMKLPEKTITVNNTVYSDVIKIKSAGNLSHPKDIKYIFWSKRNGFVKLEAKNGDIWELVNK